MISQKILDLDVENFQKQMFTDFNAIFLNTPMTNNTYLAMLAFLADRAKHFNYMYNINIPTLELRVDAVGSQITIQYYKVNPDINRRISQRYIAVW